MSKRQSRTFEELRLATVGEAYQAFMRVALVDFSPATRKWYQNRLGRFVELYGENNPISEVTTLDLLTWKSTLAERDVLYGNLPFRYPVNSHLAPHTIHSHIRSVRRFFRWLWKQGVLEENLGECLDLPRLPKSSRKGIGERDRQRIMAAAQRLADGGDIYAVRDVAIMHLLESSGVRRGGLANLLISDLDLENPDPRLRRRITVREKGGAERLVLVTEGALQAIVDWLAFRPRAKDNHVFVGARPGEPWRALTPGGISQILQRYREALNIEGRTSPHQWRHRWAKKKLQDGLDLTQVSQLMGHSSVVVTSEYYAQFTLDELQDAYDGTHRKAHQRSNGQVVEVMDQIDPEMMRFMLRKERQTGVKHSYMAKEFPRLLAHLPPGEIGEDEPLRISHNMDRLVVVTHAGYAYWREASVVVRMDLARDGESAPVALFKDGAEVTPAPDED